MLINTIYTNIVQRGNKANNKNIIDMINEIVQRKKK